MTLQPPSGNDPRAVTPPAGPSTPSPPDTSGRPATMGIYAASGTQSADHGTSGGAAHGTAPGTAGREEPGRPVEQLPEQARNVASQVADRVQSTAGQVAEQVQQQATSRIDEQKERASGGLGSLAQAVRQTGQELRRQDEGSAVAQYADSAAQQLERMASYLRTRDAAQLFDEAEDLARRQPALFLGGALTLGFLGARFLMASGQRAARRRYAQSAAAPASPAPYVAQPAPYGAPELTDLRETPPTTIPPRTTPIGPASVAGTGAAGAPSSPSTPGAGGA